MHHHGTIHSTTRGVPISQKIGGHLRLVTSCISLGVTRLILDWPLRAGWAYSEDREREREREREEKEGERVWERERDSGTRPEPQRAVTKRSLVTHTEAHSARVSELDRLLNITSFGEEEVPSVRACSWETSDSFLAL